MLLTEADTSGEKLMETFVGQGEEARAIGIEGTLAVPGLPGDNAALGALLTLVAEACADPRALPTPDTVTGALAQVVPQLTHKATGRSLDDRM